MECKSSKSFCTERSFMSKLSEFCCVCGNLGFPDKECPACHRQPTQKSMNFEFKDNTEFAACKTLATFMLASSNTLACDEKLF